MSAPQSPDNHGPAPGAPAGDASPALLNTSKALEQSFLDAEDDFYRWNSIWGDGIGDARAEIRSGDDGGIATSHFDQSTKPSINPSIAQPMDSINTHPVHSTFGSFIDSPISTAARESLAYSSDPSFGGFVDGSNESSTTRSSKPFINGRRESSATDFTDHSMTHFIDPAAYNFIGSFVGPSAALPSPPLFGTSGDLDFASFIHPVIEPSIETSTAPSNRALCPSFFDSAMGLGPAAASDPTGTDLDGLFSVDIPDMKSEAAAVDQTSLAKQTAPVAIENSTPSRRNTDISKMTAGQVGYLEPPPTFTSLPRSQWPQIPEQTLRYYTNSQLRELRDHTVAVAAEGGENSHAALTVSCIVGAYLNRRGQIRNNQSAKRSRRFGKAELIYWQAKAIALGAERKKFEFKDEEWAGFKVNMTAQEYDTYLDGRVALEEMRLAQETFRPEVEGAQQHHLM